MATVEQTPNESASARILLLLLVLFVASGCAALIYEIVWFQLLELVIGSSTVSLGVLLGTFMGGLCLGSFALARFIPARCHPLIVYGLLELGIGVSAIAVLFGLPYAAGFYVAHADYGLANVLLRGAICGLMLLPPTVLMGATLPAVARWVESSPKGVSWLGILYTANIVGAVFGCLLAGFYLLRVHDLAIASYVAMAINLALAAIAIAFAATIPHQAATTVRPEDTSTSAAARPPDLWVVYLVIGLSGLTALGSQVIWTRVLALLLGATVYTFSIILAVFLVGLGVGSGIGSFIARNSVRPRLALGLCQLLLAACLGWAAATINGSLPYWPIDLSLTITPFFNFQLDLVRVAWAIFPATCLWGASFPLALAAAASRGEDPGRLAGAVYSANTIGAIVGALAFSIVLIAAIGTLQSQRLLMGICLIAGLLILIVLMPDAKGAVASAERPVSARAGMSIGVVAVIASAILAWTLPPLPGGLAAFGRMLLRSMPLPTVLYVGEGINSTVAVTEWEDWGIRGFSVSGRPEASSEPHDMRLERMLGHLPALLHRKPRSVLIVGFGAGVTAGSFVLYPGIERIVICELEPLIPRVVSTYFSKENYDVLKDPRVEVIYDDARHYLLTTREQFDIITSDPIHPWVKGSATLYTREYFDLVRKHLNPGGLVTQWVPFYESTAEVVKSQIATFFGTFPRGLIFGNRGEGWNSETVLFGELEPGPIEPERIQRLLDSPDYRRVKEALAEVEFNRAVDLLATYAGRESELQRWLKGAEINTDRNLRLQYLAGMGSFAAQAEEIYDDLVRQRRFPDDLFSASEETNSLLREAMTSKNSATDAEAPGEAAK